MTTVELTETSHTGCPMHLRGSENTVPFDFYADLRRTGPVVWDESMNGWLVTTLSACREVFRSDNTLFRHPDGDAGGDYAVMSPGLRPLKTLTGEPQRKLHNWMMKAFTPAETSAMRDGLIRDVILAALENVEGRTEIDLVADFIDLIPVRVVAAVLDLPWRDKEFMDRAQGNLALLAGFFNRRGAMTSDVSKSASQATEELKAQLRPILEHRRDNPGADLISKLWRDGPTILDNWTIDDTFVNVNTVFLGGYDTTTMAISNSFWFMLKRPEFKARFIAGDNDIQQRYVEEVLRLLPPIHYRARRANQDTEIAGVTIRKNDLVFPLMGAANRDEGIYDCPADMSFERKNPRDHMTFISGPRNCVGSGLARVEVREALQLFLQKYPDVELDRTKPEPQYIGLTTRRFEPMFVRLVK
ncbi:MAG: cytochrome P450 [Paracoccus sp. (in: a-proteobacteria)]|uniref:cytochrome P450 n=1 Tax=Paracoccus sp. TaxID=267 RepID=UPI0039E430F4